MTDININNNNINVVNNINNVNNKNDFKITPEKVKYLMEHKKDIITIQKNWKTFYDVNRFKLLKYKTLIIQNFFRKYLIKKYNLPSNFYYNDKFLKMQTELYEETYNSMNSRVTCSKWRIILYITHMTQVKFFYSRKY